MERMRLAIAFGVIALGVASGAGTAGVATYWQHDPSEPGDWSDPANWTVGVPAHKGYAYIDNGGTAEIAYGSALAGQINIGTSNAGAVVQSGGAVLAEMNINLGGQGLAGQPPGYGAYTLIGGELSAASVIVGHGLGSGLFTQTGGTAQVDRLKVGDLPFYPTLSDPGDSEGVYELTGGMLETRVSLVGGAGRGRFVQDGGVHAVEDLLQVGGWGWTWGVVPLELPPLVLPLVRAPDSLLTAARVGPAATSIYIPPPPPSEGRYELNAGQLSARRQEIRRTGLLRQTGGSNEVGYLSVSRGGTYEYLAGSLEVAFGLNLDGDLDFGGGAVTLAAGSALLNFSRGELLNAANASITAGPDSLVIFAEGFDPDELGHFSTEGLVHFAGRDLHISRRQGFTGWGVIDDHVRVHGWIAASAGGRIDLREGLSVHGGSVDLGAGELTVMNARSGIHRGQLTAGSITVGSALAGQVLPDGTLITYPPGRFRQTGGTVAVADDVTIVRGRYELRGGAFSARKVEVGGQFPSGCPSEFVQSGGTSTVANTLRVGAYYPVHVALNYDRLRPLFAAGGAGAASARSIDPLPIFPPALSTTYRLSGGSLSAGSLVVATDIGQARFVQTGGRVDVGNTLSIRGDEASYVVFGGSLAAPVLSVGSRDWPTAGTLGIRGAHADIRISQRLSFGAGSQFVAAPGSSVHITGPAPEPGLWLPAGSTVEIWGTDPAALAGLGNLTLIFEGGDQLTATLEAAGADRGDDCAGFLANFALDGLWIGGDDVGQVQLVDLFDNQPEWAGVEAVYVESLIVGDGSLLDLNGLNLYYLDAAIDPGATIIGGVPVPVPCVPGGGRPHGRFGGKGWPAWADHYAGGGGAAAVPAPAAMGLLALGGGALILRRRRGRFPRRENSAPVA